jgi:hypothetical protein
VVWVSGPNADVSFVSGLQYETLAFGSL